MAKSLLLTNTYAPMLGAYNQLIRENNDSIKILREQLKDLKE